MRKIYYLVIAVLVFSLIVACASAASPWMGNKSSFSGQTYTKTFTPPTIKPSYATSTKAVTTYDAMFALPVIKPSYGKTYDALFKIPWN